MPDFGVKTQSYKRGASDRGLKSISCPRCPGFRSRFQGQGQANAARRKSALTFAAAFARTARKRLSHSRDQWYSPYGGVHVPDRLKGDQGAAQARTPSSNCISISLSFNPRTHSASQVPTGTKHFEKHVYSYFPGVLSSTWWLLHLTGDINLTKCNKLEVTMQTAIVFKTDMPPIKEFRVPSASLVSSTSSSPGATTTMRPPPPPPPPKPKTDNKVERVHEEPSSSIPDLGELLFCSFYNRFHYRI